jgi:alkylation response protein AidB-like acyl-CoA dehydrogenase
MAAGVDSLTDQQRKALEKYREFSRAWLAPHADDWDTAGTLPTSVVAAMATEGHLAAVVPARYGGAGLDLIDFGLLNEAVGEACSSVRSVLTVHSMVCRAVSRWGSEDQRAHWLPRLAAGDALAAFALSEPGAGSDAAALATVARHEDGHFVLDGTKKWITFGQAADVYLVFARLDGAISAFLVERDTPGLTVVPVPDVLGTRASMLAELQLAGCRVPRTALLGRPGFGLLAVAGDALELGRYSVAWGCVGLAQSCLEISLDHARGREQFGSALVEHQLVRQLITDMATGLSAARLLCLQAGRLKEAGHRDGTAAVWMAKYAASTHAFRAASGAVQIQGAQGCLVPGTAQRHLRDAKVMEIIEGSTQIQQTTIAELIS